MSVTMDWNPLRSLARRVLEEGEPLELTEEVRALLLQTAQDVGLREPEAATVLHSPAQAQAFLEEARRRIDEGADRLQTAWLETAELRDEGAPEEACRLLRDLLAVEVVPAYRQHAEDSLHELTRLAEVSATGRLSTGLPDRDQLAVLGRRLQRGHGLEPSPALTLLLRRLASEVGLDPAESQAELQRPGGDESLLRLILARFRDGKQRLLRAVHEMVRLRDAGDLEGARQQLRDVLAVETVMLYRLAAEEQLGGLDP